MSEHAVNPAILGAQWRYGRPALLLHWLVAAIVLHVLAGFKHLLVDKDKVFQRMWF